MNALWPWFPDIIHGNGDGGIKNTQRRSTGLDPLPDTPVNEDVPVLACPPEAPAVIVSHYWLSGTPQRLADNVICLDYSVATGGNGQLPAAGLSHRRMAGREAIHAGTPQLRDDLAR